MQCALKKESRIGGLWDLQLPWAMKCNNSSNFKKPSIPTNYSQLETMQIFSAINLIGETMYEFF
jgi:hypothetical protein